MKRTPKVIRQAEKAARRPLRQVTRQKIAIISFILLLIVTLLTAYAFAIYNAHHG